MEKNIKQSLRTNKILLITNIPTPYRIPLFNELSKQLCVKELRLRVVFGATGYDRRKWAVDMSDCKFDYVVLPSKNIPYHNPEKSSFTYPGLYHLISEDCSSIIITNAFSIATTKIWVLSWFKHIQYIIWSGAILRRDMPDSALRRLQRRLLIRKAIGFVAYGKKAKDYLVSLGADEDKVEIGINTVDTQFYMKETKRFRRHLTPCDGKKHLLCISYLVPRKNIIKILEVINIISKIQSNFVLDIVGDGDDRGRLEKYVMNNKLNDVVKFHGFKQKDEIPKFMAHSSCFLYQTDFDIWGLVLVEAMAAGLPCIASVHAGATQDLIQDGITGFVMDFSETEKVAEKISWVLENPELARNVGQNASQFITENASIKKSSTGFVKAITKSLDIVI